MNKRKSFIGFVVFAWVFMAIGCASLPLKIAITEDALVTKLIFLKLLASGGAIYLLVTALGFLFGWAFAEGMPRDLTSLSKGQVLKIIAKEEEPDHKTIYLYVRFPLKERKSISIPYAGKNDATVWLKDLVVGYQYVFNGRILEPLPIGKQINPDGKVTM